MIIINDSADCTRWILKTQESSLCVVALKFVENIEFKILHCYHLTYTYLSVRETFTEPNVLIV